MAGVLSVVPVDAWRNEGTGGGATAFTFRVLRRGDIAGAASVDWSVVGMPGALGFWAADAADFGATFGTVSFAPGQASVLFSVAVLPDGRSEFDEGFAVVLSNPSLGARIELPVAAGSIRNDDANSIGFSAGGAVQSEGSGGTTAFTFTLERPGLNYAGGLGVAWRVVPAVAQEGPPASEADFPGGVFPSGVVTFAEGQSSLTLTVPVLADTLDEGTELFAVLLSDPFGGAAIDTPSALGVILDDDDTAFLSIAAANWRVIEGNSGSAVATFTVTRTGDFARAHGGLERGGGYRQPGFGGGFRGWGVAFGRADLRAGHGAADDRGADCRRHGAGAERRIQRAVVQPVGRRGDQGRGDVWHDPER